MNLKNVTVPASNVQNSQIKIVNRMLSYLVKRIVINFMLNLVTSPKYIVKESLT